MLDRYAASLFERPPPPPKTENSYFPLPGTLKLLLRVCMCVCEGGGGGRGVLVFQYRKLWTFRIIGYTIRKKTQFQIRKSYLALYTRFKR